MALHDYLTLPGFQGKNTSDAPTEAERRKLHIEQVTKGVELEIEKRSVLQHMFPKQIVTGTSTLATYGFGGEAKPQALKLGDSPEGQAYQVGKATVSIDTPVLMRARVGQLDQIQTHLAIRSLISHEQGQKLANFIDETYMIAAAKAALSTQTPLTGLTEAMGFGGGNQFTLANAGYATDPSALLDAMNELETMFTNRNIVTDSAGFVTLVSPNTFKILRRNNEVLNKEIILSDGTSRTINYLNLYGIPIVRTPQFVGGRNITGHEMSNASNGNAYDGDFSKVIALTVAPKALVDGFAYHVRHDEDENFGTKELWLDTWVAFAVGVARPEYAGVVMAP